MSETQNTPPGWYSDESGRQRYWDGKAWGVYAPDQTPVPVVDSAPVRLQLNGAAVAGLVLGILAAITFWIPVLGIIIAALGIIFSSVGLWLIKRQQRASGRAVAAAGLVLSVVSAFIFLFMLLLVASNNGTA